jgi:hypothetical protein
MAQHQPIALPKLNPAAAVRLLLAKLFGETDRGLIIGAAKHLRADEVVRRA